MARGGIEPPTYRFSGGRSYQLSYLAAPLPGGRDPASLPDLPGPPVLGFVACGAVVRRAAYLACGGFEPRLGIGGEEELLAADLAAAGWRLVYAPEVVAHHHPAPGPRGARRARVELRNALWSCWLRRPPARALRRTAALVAAGGRAGPAALAEAATALGWVSRRRRGLPADVEAALRTLE